MHVIFFFFTLFFFNFLIKYFVQNMGSTYAMNNSYNTIWQNNSNANHVVFLLMQEKNKKWRKQKVDIHTHAVHLDTHLYMFPYNQMS